MKQSTNKYMTAMEAEFGAKSPEGKNKKTGKRPVKTDRLAQSRQADSWMKRIEEMKQSTNKYITE